MNRSSHITSQSDCRVASKLVEVGIELAEGGKELSGVMIELAEG